LLTSVLHAFENDRDTLTSADTHGHQGVLAAAALQFIYSLGGDESAGTADRVAVMPTARSSR